MDLGSSFSRVGYALQHIPNQSPEGEDRYLSKAPMILAYPTSLCMRHTKGTGNYPKKTSWLQLGKYGFGEQIMHLSEYCNRKGFKKNIGLYRHGSSTASMLMVELLHVLKIAYHHGHGRLWKSCRNITQNTEYDAFGFCHYCTLKQIEAPWIQAHLCVINVHICHRVH